MTDIMKHVDILDLVKIYVFQNHPGFLDVRIECLEDDKNVVFDEKALNILNHEVTKRTKGMSINHPNTYPFVKEFVGRMLSELYRNGLVEIEQAQEPQKDPYADLRTSWDRPDFGE